MLVFDCKNMHRMSEQTQVVENWAGPDMKQTKKIASNHSIIANKTTECKKINVRKFSIRKLIFQCEIEKT